MKLRIRNKGAVAYSYIINILSPSKITGAVKNGYADIPDTSWIWPQEKEVMIAGNRVKEVELFLKVPDEKQYQSKSFQAVIEVKSEKNSSKQIFVVAVQLPIFFSTQGKIIEVQPQ